MKEREKSKGQLIDEIANLRQQVAELELSNSQTGVVRGEGRETSILDSLIEHVVYEDTEMRIIWANQAACKSVGLSREELIGRYCYEIWPKREDPCPDCPVIKAMQTGHPHKVEKTTPDGRPWLIRGIPVRGANDDVIGGVEITLEITKRKRAEEALQESEERFNQFFENDPEYCYMISPEGMVLDVNKAALHMLGYRKKELVGKPLNTIYAPESQRKINRLFSKWRRIGRLKDEEMIIITKEGERRTMLLSASAVRERTGKTQYSVSVQRDITERKRAEVELWKANTRLNTLLDTISDVIYFKDVQGRNLVVNKAFEKMVGLGKKEILGKTDDQLFPGELAKQCKRSDAEVIKRHKVVAVEEQMTNEKGEKIFFDTVKSPVIDDQRNIVGLVGVSRNVTKHKRIEETLRVEKAYLEKLFESSPEAIAVVDTDSRVLRANSAFTRVFGYTLDETLGRSIDELLAPDALREEAYSLTKQVVRGEGGALESVRQCKDGTLVDVSILGKPIKVNGGQVAVYAIYRDITERKRAEEVLQRITNEQAVLLSTVPAMIFWIDKEGNFIRVNEAFAAALQKPPDDIKGKSLFDLYPEDMARRFNNDNLVVMKSGIPKRLIEEPVETPEGIMWVSTDKIPYREENGDIIGIIGFSVNITDRKRAEEEKAKLENQLRQAQKMEAVGTLAGGIAHDFNNLLGGILGYSSLLLSKLAPDDPHRKYVELIERASNRAAELTNRLLGFARQGKYENKPVDINYLVGGVVELLSASVDKRIEIKTELCEDNPLTKGDQNQLEQVLMNLCVNARDAMPNGGQLSINSRQVHLDEGFASKHLGATPGDYLCITVSDTGMGMDKETKAKIFDPFFTTKEQGRGTGLGLSMVYGIVKNHGGYLSVYSEAGKGTTFEIYLPLAQDSLIRPERKEEKVSLGSESILVVDDEEILRHLMKDILENLGYGVMLASDGQEAVDLYREHQAKIDMVIVDMMMPRMGGKETFQELKRINPEVKALLASGYAKNTAAQGILDLGVKDFLHKPFSLEEISNKVRKALDAR